MRVLQIINQAFRTLVEEQDDPILWLVQSMRSAQGDLILLLCGPAVYYATLKRRQPALSLAGWQQTEPADVPHDLAALVDSGVPVYAVSEDLAERGLGDLPLAGGVRRVSRLQLVELCEQVDQIWHM